MDKQWEIFWVSLRYLFRTVLDYAYFSPDSADVITFSLEKKIEDCIGS